MTDSASEPESPPSPARSAGSVWTRWLLVAAVALVAVAGRTVSGGTSALERGEAHLAAHERLEATLALREAIAWQMPFAWWREPAMEALWGLYEAQAQGAPTEAATLEAQAVPAAAQWQAVTHTLSSLRSGLFASRTPFGPDAAWRAKVEERLAPAMAYWERAAQVADGRDLGALDGLEARTAHYAAILARNDGVPGPAGSFAAGFGFLLWVGAGLRAGFASAGVRRRWLVASVVGLVAFLTGVAVA